MSRKSLLSIAPLALGAFVGAAQADDSSITLYGILDEAIANIAHSFNFDPNFVVAGNPLVNKGTQTATGLLNGGMSATRWGIKGQEDLGGGTKAIFLLEEGFNLPSGQISNAALSLANNKSTGPNVSVDSAIPGQLFNRGAYTGLSSNTYGTLTAGRQQSFFLDNIAIFDPLLGSQAFSPIGFSGSYGGGGFTDDSRADNSLKYKIPVGDFTLGALYKFGGVAGSTSAQGAYELNAVYSTGPVAVQIGYESFRDGFSLSNNTGAGSIKATAADTKAYMASAKYTWEQTTFKVGYEREEFNNPSNPTVDQAVTSVFGVPLGAVANVTAYDTQKSLNVYWFGVGQDFTPAFSLLAGLYHVNQNSFLGTSSGCSTTKEQGQCLSGSLNYYSLVGDYHFSKRTDSYLGIMIDNVSGGPANAVLNTAPAQSVNTNRIIALGMRHIF